MEDRNITNMITSIISAVVTCVFIPLVIVFYANNTLGVILLSITYPLLLVYFILKSIYFGTNNNVLFRLFRVFGDISISLISSYLILQINFPIKWVLFGIINFISLFNIFTDIFDSLKLVRDILILIVLLIVVYCILSIYSFNFVLYMGIIGIVLFYISNVVGRRTDNILLMSSDILSMLLFSLFLLLI